MEQKLSYEEFKKKFENIKNAESKNGAIYNEIQLNGDTITGIRLNTKEPFTIKLTNLYSAYINEDKINTSSLKEYVPRVQSPAYAILIEAKLAK